MWMKKGFEIKENRFKSFSKWDWKPDGGETVHQLWEAYVGKLRIGKMSTALLKWLSLEIYASRIFYYGKRKRWAVAHGMFSQASVL